MVPTLLFDISGVDMGRVQHGPDAIERVKARLQEITTQNFETRDEETTEQDVARNLSAVFQEELGTAKSLADNTAKIFARMVSGIARDHLDRIAFAYILTHILDFLTRLPGQATQCASSPSRAVPSVRAQRCGCPGVPFAA